MKHVKKYARIPEIPKKKTTPSVQLAESLKARMKTRCFDSELFVLFQKSGLSNEELFRIFYL